MGNQGDEGGVGQLSLFFFSILCSSGGMGTKILIGQNFI